MCKTNHNVKVKLVFTIVCIKLKYLELWAKWAIEALWERAHLIQLSASQFEFFLQIRSLWMPTLSICTGLA